MAAFVIENELVRAVIDEHASEIHSFVNKETGIEYMWQGDPAFWSGRNPTLFPMVGSTWDKKLHIDGKEYVTGNHGFTRRSEFTCVEHDDSHVVMELKSSEATLKEYPFAFTLRILYELTGNKMNITYTIKNENEREMPFNFGLHPAFNCPIEKDRSFNDYHIAFSNHETFTWLDTTVDNSTELALDPEALAKTIIITDPKSSEASLTDGKHGVTVSCVGYKWLAFWSPNAPFVCIEPWHSHTDFDKVECEFKDREGTLTLDAGKTFTTAYSIKIW
ncbi:MAG: aldose 1-epimerase family protein [Solobacterium sp.]|nr:aldose 1-epimerase family protein [Solobacterium sp.]